MDETVTQPRDYTIGGLRRILAGLLFPYRALFKHQGFGSFVMSMDEERMIRVARHCVGRVLDVGCGPGNKFIRHVYPNGVGIDFHPYEGVEILHDDPASLPFPDASFDTVALNAVGGHIPKHMRKVEFKEFARLIRPGGRLVMTEGEPITQFLHHQWVFMLDKLFRTQIDVDTERGMEEGEEYCMPHREIRELITESGLSLVKRERFQWGLNNVFVAEKPEKPGSSLRTTS